MREARERERESEIEIEKAGHARERREKREAAKQKPTRTPDVVGSMCSNVGLEYHSGHEVVEDEEHGDVGAELEPARAARFQLQRA
jgi:hypothetical protein